ncbi:MAG: cysteine hydrolase family protein [Deltaproteobacteria bacterium]
MNNRYAILVIDMLNDFINGKLRLEGVEKIVPNIQKLLDFARHHNIPIIYCNDSHLPEDKELKIWGKHAMKGTRGAQVIKELKPMPKDHVITKNTYSAFFNTKLKDLLQSFYQGQGANSLIVTGIHTDICVKHTIYDAFVNGYDITVAEDGVKALPLVDKRILKYMKEKYAIEVRKIKDILHQTYNLNRTNHYK